MSSKIPPGIRHIAEISTRENTMNTRILQYGLAVAGGIALAGCTTGDTTLRADPDQSGNVSMTEFDDYMKDAIFKAVDTNGDGKVTEAEWRQVNQKDPVSEFKATDRNGDGAITRAEADAAFDKEGSLKALFKKIDTDGNGTLSKAEIQAFKDKMGKAPGNTDLEKLENAASS